jgi:two-component system, NarL family, response regulator
MTGEARATGTPGARIRVAVFDDHTMVREGIVALLEMQEDFEIVGQAGDGVSAIEFYRAQRPDVALVDLRMPGKDGVAVIAAVRQEFPGARFLVLTTYDGEDDISRALHAGARGYLLKGASRAALADAIRAVHAGQRYVAPDLADRLLPRPSDEALTDREIEVLRAIAKGMANKEIAEALHISESTVKGHVNNLLAKLGVSDRTKALVVALRRGLVQLD